jgi:haloacetate dehalogenase
MTELFDLPLQTALVNGLTIAYRRAGTGAPLLLLHGFPQSHVLWHKVWPQLTERFDCVAMDLRGYGDSEKPHGGPPHATYSKRAMASDALELMRQCGFARFNVLAHDRGARVAHRLALDDASAVQRLVLLDIAPTLDMYRATNEAFARLYYHWFFLIQPAPMPEKLIASDPAWYVRNAMAGRFGATGENGLGPFDARAMAQYVRCAALPGWPHAICEDYRASAGIDLELDQASRDGGHRMQCPTLVMVGEQGVVARLFDAATLWRAQCLSAQTILVPGGHYIPEEAPAALLEHALPFFAT